VTRGRFITFEGIDGAGKSTHLAWAQQFLQGRGIKLVVTREPGGTPLGELLRDLLLGSDQPIHAETEALLVFASRRQHLEQVIQPAMLRGDWVLCDRFTDASFAYQGGGRGVPKEKLEALEAWTHPHLQPDLTLFFDVSAEVGRERVARIKSPDRFERENAAFFSRVRDAYLDRMRAAPQRIARIDSGRNIPEIQKEVEEHLLQLWKK
jgi:dTMP kinase